MSDYIISCCSTADITKEHFNQRNISYICFHYELDGKEYVDDLGETMSFDAFYQAMKDGASTRTSQVNVKEYEAYFEKFLKEGKDILHVTLSSGISGSVNSAMIAKAELEEKYPDRKVFVVDSLCASSGYGLLMDKIADKRDEGMDVDSLYEWAMKNRMNLQHWFFPTDLTYLIRGGRVSKTAGFIGNALSICPLMNVSFEGKLIPRAKIRTKKKAMRAVVDKMEELADDGLDYSDKCYICNSDCYEDAKVVADMVETRFPKLNGRVEIYSIGTTIGSHTGPGTLGLFFWGKERVD